MKKLYIILFLLGTPALFLTSLIALKVSAQKSASTQVLSSETTSYGTDVPYEISFVADTADARPIIIRSYLRHYSSPLEPFTQDLVNAADKYSLDFRLLVAIARQESNLCKIIPPGSHNCWGFGIYGDKVTRFDSYPEAIETVARTLKKNYIDQGLTTPEEIMRKYTPPSLEKGGAWAIAVNKFFTELE